VYIGEFNPAVTVGAFKPVGMKQFSTVAQCHLDFIMQQITFRAFVHLKGSVDDHIREGTGEFYDFIVYFIMEQLLVGFHIFLIRLGFHQIAMSLFQILFIGTMTALIGIGMTDHSSENECF
jgi:hypothetical protein